MSSDRTRPGNILLVANWESNVGYAWWLIENFWVTISRHFSLAGQKCYLVFPEITQIPGPIAESELNCEELDFGDRSRENRARLRKFIRDHDIRYVYFSDYPAYSLFYLRLRLWGVGRIVVHDHTPGERTMPSLLLRLLKRIVQRLPWITADHYIAVTDYVLRRLVEINCIPASKCSVAPNGIEPVDRDQSDPDYVYRVFGIPDSRKVVITTGRASRYKGIDFFAECANELVNRQGFSQLHFLFVGDGPDLGLFRELVGQLGIEENFTFAGKRTDVRQMLPSCYTGFHAASGEVGYSLSILEYMSAGLVTIVPDHPSTSQATVHNQTGLLYIPRDVESATEAIKTALDAEVAGRLSAAAVREVRENYSIEETNRQLIEILKPVFTPVRR
jgi:glycosyltransferase involved in cell wall biosynthesis